MEQNKKHEIIMERREVMKSYMGDEMVSDQRLKLDQPPLEKPSIGTKFINLTKSFDHIIRNNDLLQIMNSRTSKRTYTDSSITKDELAFLLWMTQGVKKVIGNERKATLRTVPSAGARHPLETYLFILNVEGLEPGLYHYLAIEHKLEFIREIENQVDRVSEAYAGQTFFANAAVGFVWTVTPYRTEWRYTADAQKYALIDVGHVCQNLYLASEAIGCGTCAIGAYEQNLADALLGLNSKPSYENDNEFVIYAAAVGKQ